MRGCFHLVQEAVGGQRSLWPPERLGPRWRVVALPILPGFAGVERSHVHAMQLEQFNLGNNVPHYDWDNQWLTGGLEAEAIVEAHLDTESIFAGIQRFAEERTHRLTRQRTLLAALS